MKITELLLEINNVVCGKFDKDLKKFNFSGVYIICNDDEVVYVGSAYARTIQERLKQYISKSDTGNTLGKAVAKSLSKSEKYDKKAEGSMDEAIERIKRFTIYAIKHDDLEYKLINLTKPIYNNCGKEED